MPDENKKDDIRFDVAEIRPDKDGHGVEIALDLSPSSSAGKEQIQMMAQNFLEVLNEIHAVNYAEMSLQSKDGKRVIVTLQRQDEGKTPHQLRTEAEAERDALKVECELLKQELATIKTV
jgi:hypothetical protein